MQRQLNPDFSSFITKSAFSVSLTAMLILMPFTVNNFFQDRYLLGVFTFLILALCTINVWLCYQGKYRLGINLFAIVPLVSLTSFYALFQLGIAGSYWAYLALISFYFLLPEKQAWLANTIFIVCVTPIALNTLELPIAIRFLAVFLGISISISLSTREINKQHKLLKDQAVTDSLSGLYNRSLLQSSLENAIHQNDRTGTDITLLMIDIDHFKSINDEFGHDVGDSTLEKFGQILSKYFRAGDMVFRIGGEEFLAILYNTDKPSGLGVADKLRREVEQLSFIDNRTVTISVGVSQLKSAMNWKQWMKESDHKLYQAKTNGRNQVVA